MPSPDLRAPVLSRRDIVDAGLCIGCGACAAGAARMDWDAYGLLKPRGEAVALSAPDPAFTATCPFSPQARDETALAADLFPGAPQRDDRLGRFRSAYVGHAERGFREGGSSGGLVTWAAAELLRRGLVDGLLHVAPSDRRASGRLFRYTISRDEDALRAGAKSRYYPVELSEVLEEVRAVPGRYAVIGVPCFIKAVHLQRRADPLLAQRIAFTLGLFCGHQKSARLVDSFAHQLGVAPAEVAAVDYRIKNPDRPANWYRAHLQLESGQIAEQDWMHLADGDWGAGFFQNAACDFCDDVVAETADIAFGDAWVEPYSSDGRGTNVAIVRSETLQQLVDDARRRGDLALEEVDAAFVVQTQAAGFRHRREGLSQRLANRPAHLRPRKRVAPGSAAIAPRRRLVYALRARIARWSHRVFRLADRTGRPALYIGWARSMLRLYQGLTWSHGRIGKVADWVERKLTPSSSPRA